MASRRQWHLSVLSTIFGAVLLASCGGDSGPVVESPTGSGPAGAPTAVGTFTRLISFGDSLSDLGTYAPATSLASNGTPPFFGGRFTTNAYNTYTSASQQSTATMWPEVVAGALGLVITPAEVGFAGQSVKCPVAAAVPALAGTCTGYGQGGAKVADPIGIGNDGKNGAALTVPLVTQVANHVARFGNFTASDLVIVFGGSNDVLYQHGAYMQIAALVGADLAAGRITADQAAANIAAARAGALTEMKNVARKLSALVRDNIIGKGAKYVAVMNIADISGTPYGGTLSADNKSLLKAMSAEFDAWLVDALTGVPVRIYDSSAGFAAITAAPASFGLTNVTVPTCDATKISAITGGKVTDGSALFCNATPGAQFNGIRAGADINTWMFADGVHPTTAGHRALGNAVLANLRAWGWVAP